MTTRKPAPALAKWLETREGRLEFALHRLLEAIGAQQCAIEYAQQVLNEDTADDN